MSTAVYPILASGLIDTLTNALQAKPVEEWPPEAIDDAIALCRRARRAVTGIRQEQEQKLQDGVQAKAFMADIEPLTQSIGPGLSALSRLADGLNSHTVATPMRDFLLEAQALVREAADLHRFLSTALAKAKAPPRPMDLNRVREAEEAYARGETKPFQRHLEAGTKE
jgi:hypothetical protein